MNRADPHRSMAVLIGTAGHLSPRLPPLAAVTNNLVELARVLSGPPVELVDAGGLAVLLDAPSQQEAATALLDRAEQAEDLLLVYFAGHGLLDENGDLYLALHGTDPRPERLSVSALPFSLVRRAIRESPARVRVLILDCCFSGVAISAMSSTEIESLVADSTRVEGTYTLTATSENAVALAPPGEDYTAFTGELIRLLRDPAAPDDLTLTGAYRHLAAALPGRGHPRPQQRTTNAAGDLVLRPADPSARPPTAPPRVTPAPPATTTPAPPQSVLHRTRNPFHPVRLRQHAGQWLWLLAGFTAAVITGFVGLTDVIPPRNVLGVWLIVLVGMGLVAVVRAGVNHARDGDAGETVRMVGALAILVAVIVCFAPGALSVVLLLIFLAQSAGAAVTLTGSYWKRDRHRFVIHFDRDGLRVISRRQECFLLWQNLERVWVTERCFCIAFKPGYSATDLPAEIAFSSRFGGYLIADLRLIRARPEEVELALAHFAGPAFRRGPDRTPAPRRLRITMPWRKRPPAS